MNKHILILFVLAAAITLIMACGGISHEIATATPSSSVMLTATTTPIFTPTLGVGRVWISPKDGMVMMFVPAGDFSMGNDLYVDEKPVHNVYLDSYWMDKTEVTNAMYAKCVEAGKCAPPNSTVSYTRPNYYGNPEFKDFPVIYVSWNDAKAYCDWADRRLPTEAEWEKAAGWDDEKKEKRVYPWGDSIDCTLANYWANNGACIGDTTKVGSFPSGVSFYGLMDMAGNVWEWVNSLYQSYPYSAGDDRENLSVGDSRVFRGGSWSDVDYYGRTSNRGGGSPRNSDNLIGFRCARLQP